MAKTSKEKSKTYHHGDLKQALVDGAVRRVEQNGVKGFSLRAVAGEVNVSSGAPYHHFRDAQALLTAVAERGFRQLNMALNTASEAAGTYPDKLAGIGTAYVLFALEKPQLFALMRQPEYWTGPDAGALQEARAATYGALASVVDGCLPEETETARKDACMAAWSFVEGLALLATDGRLQTLSPDEAPEDIARRLVGCFSPHSFSKGDQQ
ncbi:TetR/AcrR family transcriptional regulator [Pacificoceanicola onchidii]|uniref:TetR/AcrR family transcriptional regulator n=1 Tax=Pacificoceanicola onchidii TaxID=2562685 RepID=UPI0010A5B246|nr:WHG domain-containing protein [Pacificoceanicola onchidii]